MPESVNIQRFNDTVSQAFSLLYEDFPSPMDLGPEHFDITQDLDGIATWTDQDWMPICDALKWLTDEGYIRIHGFSTMACLNAVLTHKGLTVLRAVPDTVTGKGTLGDRLKDAVSSGSKDLARKLAEEGIMLGLQYATKIHF